MPGSPMIAGSAFAAGLRADFDNAYARKYGGMKDRLSKHMKLGIPSDKDTEKYFYFESAPHVKRWAKGTNASRKGFKGVQFSVSNVEWEGGVDWHWTDREDDQTKTLVSRARDTGTSMAMVHERVFFQMVGGTTDNSLLQTIPTAADGASLFATTAGGSARFGATSGNLLSGTGVATAITVRADYHTALEQFSLFQDSEGQPLLDQSYIDGGVTIYYAPALEQVMRETFVQAITAYANSTSNAGVSNVVMDNGDKVRLVRTQRLTGNSYYIFLDEIDTKAIFQQEREGVRETYATWDNSDQTRLTGMESLQWVARYGYGIAVPYGAIKVSNS